MKTTQLEQKYFKLTNMFLASEAVLYTLIFN